MVARYACKGLRRQLLRVLKRLANTELRGAQNLANWSTQFVECIGGRFANHLGIRRIHIFRLLVWLLDPVPNIGLRTGSNFGFDIACRLD